MDWPVISAADAVEILKTGGVGIDVRSPGEFRAGSIPRFCNAAILNDEHRHLVGIEYKQQGQTKAITLGLKLVEPIKDSIVSGWARHLDTIPSKQRVLICWRGGLRSKFACQWLSENGIEGLRVEGGYKAIRNILTRSLRIVPNLTLLSGMTGSGKSKLLRSFPKDSILDLELHAEHRGSAFGGFLVRPQPTQQTFENRIGFDLIGQSSARIVEDESRMIGKCVLPMAIAERMREASLVILEDSLENRIHRVFTEYIQEPLQVHAAKDVHGSLRLAFNNIEKKLGGLLHKKLVTYLDQAFAADPLNIELQQPWIESLLKQYYDPRYAYSFEAKKRKILFKGNAQQVTDFFTHYFSWRRA